MQAEANSFPPLALLFRETKRPMASIRPHQAEDHELTPTAQLAGLAHDLKGMIAVIHGYAEMLAEEDLVEGMQLKKEIAWKIMRSCSNMTETLNTSLDLSRLASGQLKANRRVVDLPAFLDECAALHLLAAKKKGITLGTELERPLPAISVDPVHLNRIVGNLLGNAIKYSPKGSRVTLRASALDQTVILEVADEGPGIPNQEIPQLFELYRKGSARPTNGESSHGLGLAIVRRLVEANNGYIGVESEPGRGSTFAVGFPLDPAHDLASGACA